MLPTLLFIGQLNFFLSSMEILDNREILEIYLFLMPEEVPLFCFGVHWNRVMEVHFSVSSPSSELLSKHNSVTAILTI